jgi:hypothetical protein
MGKTNRVSLGNLGQFVTNLGQKPGFLFPGIESGIVGGDRIFIGTHATLPQVDDPV